jgi:hypothetical protein
VVHGDAGQAFLSMAAIPWPRLRDALENRLSPGSGVAPVVGPLSVKVEVGTIVAGTAAQAASELSVMVQLRLGQLGIQVQRDAGDELRVTYNEVRTKKKAAAPGKLPGGAPAQAAKPAEVELARLHLVLRLYRNGKESAAVQELTTDVESAGGAFDERTLRAAASKMLEDLRAPEWADPAFGVLYRLPLQSSLN